MIIEIKVPTPGESITEVELGKWLVKDGAVVDKDDELAEIESDKATLTLNAQEGGKVSFKAQEGDTLEVGAVACTIDTSAVSGKKQQVDEKPEAEEAPAEKPEKIAKGPEKEVIQEEKKSVAETPKSEDEGQEHIKVTSVAKKMMEESGLSVEDIIKGLKRISKKEVEAVRNAAADSVSGTKPEQEQPLFSREESREKMSALRRKLSQRLVAVKNETAMLTTFNEVDMSRILDLRKKHQERFVEKHGLKLGFMGFFAKAAAAAMSFHPTVNSMLDDEEVVSPQYVDIGVAVQTPKGLMVPIIRNVESKSVPQIEKDLKDLAEKARNKKISVEELTGGTFTITNGGVFGSLLSTPIINPPQSAILGMHNIVERPVAINGKVEIRPMMYVALSYDHRIIDGKDSVGFLVKVKELVENPERLLNVGKNPEDILLGL